MDDAEAFGPYRLEELLGRGGMGTVHRAFDTRRERTVALKRPDERLAGDPAYRERFRRECLLAARLSSPHVVPIHDFGEIDGVLYLDMRLVEGRGLDVVLRDGALPPDRAVRTVEQTAHALDAAHAPGSSSCSGPPRPTPRCSCATPATVAPATSPRFVPPDQLPP